MKANTQRRERLECEDTNEIHNYQTKNFKGSLEQQLGFSKNSNWRKSYRLIKNNSSHQQIEKNEICGENKLYSQNRTVFQRGSEIVYAYT